LYELFMKKPIGIVAAGHPDTAGAAAAILAAGGNAFDAALAALFSSCVCEPVLASLGGGGFLLAHPQNGNSVLYDFFAHTPARKPPVADLDFHPIIADFGTAQQEFHIGMGSIAVPGAIRGIYAIHSDRCTLPLEKIVQPALQLARDGVQINGFQHYISNIVAPIIHSSPAALRLHQGSTPGEIAAEDETVRQPEMADLFSALVEEGEGLFYHGELARRLADDCRDMGGAIDMQDLANYRVEPRVPLSLGYRDTRLLTNPAPSIGGTLIAFTLALLEQEGLCAMQFHGSRHLRNLAHAMRLTQQLRLNQQIDSDLDAVTSQRIIGSELIEGYRQTLREHTTYARGTTQISVADAVGNMASMTLSNGEGSGYVLPGTGIMLNNMLGEEDINPHGFHQWPQNRRIASMMAPTLACMPNGDRIATGSGGSNRIRSAILQVLINLIDFRMDTEQAVEQARIHFESELLHMESGIPDVSVEELAREFSQHRLWPQKNLFFGGAHTVIHKQDGSLHGRGDSRRGGVCIQV
jgi:gamma-glutamyltranspeptidase / glutathione hydrolase